MLRGVGLLRAADECAGAVAATPAPPSPHPPFQALKTKEPSKRKHELDRPQQIKSPYSVLGMGGLGKGRLEGMGDVSWWGGGAQVPWWGHLCVCTGIAGGCWDWVSCVGWVAAPSPRTLQAQSPATSEAAPLRSTLRPMQVKTDCNNPGMPCQHGYGYGWQRELLRETVSFLKSSWNPPSDRPFHFQIHERAH